ncbi:cytokine receptor common subunit gamma-like [Genypterus blacodes]|uniref:cytokine receptor common subunit gamma-like n=1 Tax=Genypterus blacodes TaxID=154954 RepID=UPI003F767EFB
MYISRHATTEFRLCCHTMLAPLFLLLYLTGHTLARKAPDVVCVVINLKYVQCSWDGPAEGNCSFSSRFFENKNFRECCTYVSKNNTRTGCDQTYDGLATKRFNTFYTKLVCSNNSFEHPHELKKKVKLNPPFNLTVLNGSDGNLWFYWNHSALTCGASEVRYRINNYKWETSSPRDGKNSHCINLPSSSSLYELQVRTTMWSDCGGSDFWSDWSKPVFWGSMRENNSTEVNHGVMSVWTSVYSAIGAAIFILLVGLLVYHERLRIIPIPIVPKPGPKFDNILKHHNVEDWLRISKPLNQGFKANFNDLACSVREYKQVVLSESENSDGSTSECLSTSCSSASSILLVPSKEEEDSV